MQKYIPLIIAVVTLVAIVLSGVFHILPSDTVTQIAVLIISFLLGHISAPTTRRAIQKMNQS